MPGAKGFIHRVDEAPAFWMQGILWTMLADAEETGGRWSMMEQLLPKGSGPPPHKHLWSDETFYILDGKITVLIEDRIEAAGKGTFVSVARATRHAFRVDSDTARFLTGYTPASMEAMVSELGRRTDQRRLPPPGSVATSGSMPENMLTRYGLIWLDEPDPLQPRARHPENGHDMTPLPNRRPGRGPGDTTVIDRPIIALAGASGDLGGRIARALAARGADVRALVRRRLNPAGLGACCRLALARRSSSSSSSTPIGPALRLPRRPRNLARRLPALPGLGCDAGRAPAGRRRLRAGAERAHG